MSAKIESISLDKGDHLFIRCFGSVEKSVSVSVGKDGYFRISGPFNVNERTVVVGLDGMTFEHKRKPAAPGRGAGLDGRKGRLMS